MTDAEDFSKATKPELRKALQAALTANVSLTDAVGRLLRRPEPPAPRQQSREEDTVPAGWAERNGISIPRAEGIHESREAWVRVKSGVIVGAGLKNQSILLLMVSLRLLDQGAEHHGNLYKDWRAAFLSRVDPTKSGEPGGGNPNAWSKEDRYSKLIHRLDKDLLAAMDSIVAVRPKAKHLAAFQGHQETFAGAFMQVVNAMRDINREAGDSVP
ncbi:hypothetical protein [Limnoglobus roseus]|uniref:Uncharacterized protein n=1 Tax=Limnoglobus roseus TaxID=2598579 RepID=A0A5C1AAC7_9BACT|nr:hypothetical protein [Limnoglobus roseus]QEL14772.1 hypothetical protein PX52LOC_01666 [Limnoglobus roseus]